MKKVLLIAFHFPPLVGSSGVQRTLRFAQHLPAFGWQPYVLTAHPAAYERTDDHLLDSIPPECHVVRARCYDAVRQFSLFGRYPSFLEVPDRWASWRLWAPRAARRVIAEQGIQAIWSTYPIATAHWIGAAIARSTDLPWIADFRDPMVQGEYPTDPRRWRSFKRIEEQVAARSARMVFVSPSALTRYRRRYPALAQEHLTLIENGFDEDAFAALDDIPAPVGDCPVLLHSGVVYPSERDPAALFGALGQLKRSGQIAAGDFVIRFRAPVHEQLLHDLAQRHDITDFIEVKPAIPYAEALLEMKQAAALLVMQGANCNDQIPAKLYEYFRAQRPILGLVDPQGDTAWAMEQLEYREIAALESEEAIRTLLPAFLQKLRRGDLPIAPRAIVDRYSRRGGAEKLAAELDSIVVSPVDAR